jgi:hypothetical protein
VAYERFGPDSDLYIYRSDANEYNCVPCGRFTLPRLAAHVATHQQAKNMANYEHIYRRLFDDAVSHPGWALEASK